MRAATRRVAPCMFANGKAPPANWRSLVSVPDRNGARSGRSTFGIWHWGTSSKGQRRVRGGRLTNRRIVGVEREERHDEPPWGEGVEREIGPINAIAQRAVKGQKVEGA